MHLSFKVNNRYSTKTWSGYTRDYSKRIKEQTF